MGGGVTGQRTVIRNITKPATPEAQLWNGWKSHGLKPAYEPILVCMKPNDGSYAENALKHGVSGLNIDGGRINTDEDCSRSKYQVRNTPAGMGKGLKMGGDGHEQGRFPANVIFEDGVTNAEWSRFFYCAKASKAERNMGCEELDIKQTTGGGGMNNTKDDVCGKYGSIKASGHNHHPTVKPLKLMEYLCTLTKTPTGGIVFDPFMGSGTTGIACKNTGREFIGCETDKDYFEIAGKRLR
jgi:site-specific DNA-methyltransferase (adenine-specific)